MIMSSVVQYVFDHALTSVVLSYDDLDYVASDYQYEIC